VFHKESSIIKNARKSGKKRTQRGRRTHPTPPCSMGGRVHEKKTRTVKKGGKPAAPISEAGLILGAKKQQWKGGVGTAKKDAMPMS